jgi:hypothetical protein
MQTITVDINSLESITSTLKELENIFASRQTQGSYKIRLNPDIPCSDEINSINQFLLDMECPVDDEALLCLVAAQYPETHDQMLDLIKAISHYNRFEAKNSLMRDYETPFGFYIALALALHNQEQIVYWTEFIKGLDLNHEVYEAYAMNALFRSHGLTSSMLDLATERVLLPSQFGHDQVHEWLKPVKDQPIFAEFIKRLADDTCNSFIEDTSKHKNYARQRFEHMNMFLADVTALPNN